MSRTYVPDVLLTNPRKAEPVTGSALRGLRFANPSYELRATSCRTSYSSFHRLVENGTYPLDGAGNSELLDVVGFGE